MVAKACRGFLVSPLLCPWNNSSSSNYKKKSLPKSRKSRTMFAWKRLQNLPAGSRRWSCGPPPPPLFLGIERTKRSKRLELFFPFFKILFGKIIFKGTKLFSDHPVRWFASEKPNISKMAAGTLRETVVWVPLCLRMQKQEACWLFPCLVQTPGSGSPWAQF